MLTLYWSPEHIIHLVSALAPRHDPPGPGVGDHVEVPGVSHHVPDPGAPRHHLRVSCPHPHRAVLTVAREVAARHSGPVLINLKQTRVYL